MKTVQIITLFMALIFAGSCYADRGRHRNHNHHDDYYSYQRWVENQQYQQRHSIQNSFYQGLLTASERRKLNRQQRRIADMICDYERDRYFSKWERRRINKHLLRAEKHIYKYTQSTGYGNHGHANYVATRLADPYPENRVSYRDYKLGGGVYVQW